MKHMIQTLAALALIGAATPGLAQDGFDAATMTCSEFMGLSADRQKSAIEQLDMAANEGMPSEDLIAEDALSGMMAACNGHPDMMAIDAMMSISTE